MLDANHPGVTRARSLDRIGLHHVIVLLPHPALAANVRTGEKLFQSLGEVSNSAELNMLRHLARNRRLPPLQRTLIHRSIIGESLIRNLGDDFSVMQNSQNVSARD